MKLEKEQIQFIDNYLDNSDVVYADIRMEMVDHVASGIEAIIDAGDTRDFYYIFKDYMVENKAKLLDDNKRFLKSADKKIWKAILNELPKPLTIIIFIVAFFGFYNAFNHLDFKSFRILIFTIPFGTFLGFGVFYLIYSKYYGLGRFSVTERLSFPMLLFYQLSSLILWVIGIVSMSLTFLFILSKISLSFAKIYQERFKNLV
jgi:hypothetical protein